MAWLPAWGDLNEFCLLESLKRTIRSLPEKYPDLVPCYCTFCRTASSLLILGLDMFQHVPTHGYTSLRPAITGHSVSRNYRARRGALVSHALFRNNHRLEKRLCDKLYAKLEKTGPESYEWLKLPFERRPWNVHKNLSGFATIKMGAYPLICVESDLRSGRPSWRINNIVMADVQDFVRADQILIIREVAEEQWTINTMQQLLQRPITEF